MIKNKSILDALFYTYPLSITEIERVFDETKSYDKTITEIEKRVGLSSPSEEEEVTKGLQEFDVEKYAHQVYDKWVLEYEDKRYMTKDLFTLAVQDVLKFKTPVTKGEDKWDSIDVGARLTKWEQGEDAEEILKDFKAEAKIQRASIFKEKGYEGEFTENIIEEALIRMAKYGLSKNSSTVEHESIKRLYNWIIDENRDPSQTFFTEGELRNVAKEIEFRMQKAVWAILEEFKDRLLNNVFNVEGWAGRQLQVVEWDDIDTEYKVIKETYKI